MFRFTRRRAKLCRLSGLWALLWRRWRGKWPRPCRHRALSGGHGGLLNCPDGNIWRFGGHPARSGSGSGSGRSCRAKMSHTDAGISRASAVLSSAGCSRPCHAPAANSVRYAYGSPVPGEPNSSRISSTSLLRSWPCRPLVGTRCRGSPRLPCRRIRGSVAPCNRSSGRWCGLTRSHRLGTAGCSRCPSPR